MKKIVFLLIGAIFALVAKADTIGSFSLTRTDDVTYIVETSFKDGKFHDLMIEVPTKSGKGGIMFKKGQDIIKFRDALIQARDKYVEWAQIAKENSTGNVSKDMEMKFPKVTYCWKYGDWHFDFNAPFKLKFVSSNGVNLVMSISSHVASDNRFIKEEFELVFMNVGDFDALINALDVEKINAAINAKSQNDLFK